MTFSDYNQSYFAKRGVLFPEIKGLFFAFLIKLILNPKTLLDVGCGEGKLVKWATKFGINARGVDISLAGFGKEEKRLRQRCFEGDILELPFKNKEFEVVSCLAVMEHVYEKETSRALKELSRVSQKYIFLQICVKDNPLEEKHYFKDVTHINVQNSSWWLRRFQSLKIETKFSLSKFGWFILVLPF